MTLGKKGIWIEVEFLTPQGTPGRALRALLDTGSNWNCHKQGSLKPYVKSERPIPSNLNLIGASGSKITGVNISTYFIKIGNTVLEAEFYILDEGSKLNYTILGLGVLRKLNAKLDLSGMMMDFTGERGRERVLCSTHEDLSSPESINVISIQDEGNLEEDALGTGQKFTTSTPIKKDNTPTITSPGVFNDTIKDLLMEAGIINADAVEKSDANATTETTNSSDRADAAERMEEEESEENKPQDGGEYEDEEREEHAICYIDGNDNDFDYRQKEEESEGIEDDEEGEYLEELLHIGPNGTCELENTPLRENYEINYEKFDLFKCSEELQPLVRKEMKEFDEIFARDEFDIGKMKTSKGELFFEVQEGKRFYSTGYRMNPREATLLGLFEKKLVSAGVMAVGDGSSGWRSPNFLVKKPNKEDYSTLSSWRLVTNLQSLNALLKPTVSCLPYLESIRDALRGFKYLSVLDITQGFFAMEAHPKVRGYLATTSATSSSTLEYCRATMGLQCSPGQFQRAMEKILDDLEGEVDGEDVRSSVSCYIDDIFIVSRVGDDLHHWKILKKVLGVLKENNLKVRLDKLKLFTFGARVLGFWADSLWIRPDQSKLDIIHNWGRPIKKKDLQRFLGLANFYRSFCQNYGIIAKPLYESLAITESDQIEWTPKKLEAFQAIKDNLCNAVRLSSPDYSKAFIVTVDSSLDGAGFSLTQVEKREAKNGVFKDVERPVAFGAHAFSKKEKMAAASEREMVGLYYAIVRFSVFLRFSNKMALPIYNPSGNFGPIQRDSRRVWLSHGWYFGEFG